MTNRALRIMTFAPFRRLDLKPIYDCLQILDLTNLFLLETSKFIYKSKNTLLPTIIGNNFKVKRNIASELDFGKRHRLHFLSDLDEIWFEVIQLHGQVLLKISKCMNAKSTQITPH